MIIRQEFKTIPAVSKIFYKTSPNDTVKGFDAVHVIATQDDNLELWLGEVKFYNEVGGAIRDVIKELHVHTQKDYLRNEFAAVTNFIDDDWHYADKLKLLLHPNTTLDQVFSVLCVPVLLTYDSTALGMHKSETDEYAAQIKGEFDKAYANFCGGKLPEAIKIHLILVPLNTKEKLITALNEKLLSWQRI